jgi:flagellar biosynthesis protein FlhA
MDIIVSLGQDHRDLVEKMETRLEKIEALIIDELGFPIPGVSFVTDLELPPMYFQIWSESRSLGCSAMPAKGQMVVGAPECLERLEGDRFTDPTYGIDALWISDSDVGEVKDGMVLDRTSVLAAYLTEVIRVESSHLLDDGCLQRLLAGQAKWKDLTERGVSQNQLGTMLRGLLEERVSIAPLGEILSFLSRMKEFQVDDAIKGIRLMKRTLLVETYSQRGRLFAAVLDPEAEWCQEDFSDSALLEQLMAVRVELLGRGHNPLFIAPAAVRRSVAKSLPPPPMVLSREEVGESTEIVQLYLVRK